MTPAAILRAQIPFSADPARLEREARLIEARDAGVFVADAGENAEHPADKQRPGFDAGCARTKP